MVKTVNVANRQAAKAAANVLREQAAKVKVNAAANAKIQIVLAKANAKIRIQTANNLSPR